MRDGYDGPFVVQHVLDRVIDRKNFFFSHRARFWITNDYLEPAIKYKLSDKNYIAGSVDFLTFHQQSFQLWGSILLLIGAAIYAHLATLCGQRSLLCGAPKTKQKPNNIHNREMKKLFIRVGECIKFALVSNCNIIVYWCI